MEVDQIISLLKRYTIKDNVSSEIGEQDDATSSNVTSDTGASAGGAYPAVTKWETGLTRSVANQIDYKAKWKDLYKIARGKGNTLL